ncbi:GspE/PulE family protein [Photobacterium damselae]|uniref:GspE/PulE family protein n=1 Tax=Photobacterium damselae TaxID=38293 RepID=UPI004068A63D
MATIRIIDYFSNKMIEKITEISQLGQDWILIGTENSECSKVKVRQSFRNVVVAVKIRNEQTKTYDKICILGQKKFLTSESGYGLVSEITEKYRSEAEIRSFPVNTPELITSIYDEWRERVSNGSATIGNEKTEHEQNLRNVQYAKHLIKACLEQGVSDVHIEVRDSGTTVKKRIGVDLIVDRRISFHEGTSLCNTIYNVLAGTGAPTIDKNSFQDGLIDKVIENRRIRGRISTSPEDSGFDMVIRLIDVGSGGGSGKTPREMNYSDDVAELIDIAMTSPSGITIISGTTNSGKSTTLQNSIKLLSARANNMIKIIMIEEPVENLVNNATQINVQRDENGDASAGLNGAIRAAMRQDPDIIVIGEIRDGQTAELAAAAAQTGHKVLSTLHADSWYGVFKRLEDLGVSREVLSSKGFLNGLFYQKLLPQVCPHCCIRLSGAKIPPKMREIDIIQTQGYMSISASNDWFGKYNKTQNKEKISFIRYLQDMEAIKSDVANAIALDYKKLNDLEARSGLFKRLSMVCDFETDVINFRGNGCEHCSGLGVKGRTPVAEGAVFNKEMLEFIARGDSVGMLNYWRRSMNGKYALEDAIEKMKIGLISPTDIESHLSRITISK